MKNWYSIKNKTDEVLDVSIHDEIGLWGVSAADFIHELKSHNSVKVINLSIHSPGGNVLDGFAMYNNLASHKAKVYGKVEGIAASAASYVLMAADHIEMPEDAFIMIHNAHGGVFGDAEDMRDMADVIDKLQSSIINIYAKRTGKDVVDIAEMMKDETWMNASDAMAHGFIDTITDPVNVAAKINVFNKYFKELPVSNKKLVEDITDQKEFYSFLRESAGLSKRLAEALTSRAKEVFKGNFEETDDTMNKLSEALNKVKIPNSI